MFSRTFVAAAILSLGALSAEADTTQIARGLGLSPDEAARLSLTEIVVITHNPERRGDDRIGRPAPGDAGPAARSQLVRAAGVSPDEAAEMSLTELAAAKIRREARGDDKTGPQVDRGPFSANTQFAASAGVTPEIARGRAFDEILLVKVRRQSDD